MSIIADALCKYPLEKFAYTVDFTTVLGAATISSIAVSSTMAGTDTTSTIIDSSSNTTTIVTVTVKAGAINETHNILVRVTASDGSEYNHVTNLKISKAA